MTGTEITPPLGLPETTTLYFVHRCIRGCQCRPSASTCALQLRLPVDIKSSDYMMDMLRKSIVEEAGLDLV